MIFDGVRPSIKLTNVDEARKKNVLRVTSFASNLYNNFSNLFSKGSLITLRINIPGLDDERLLFG